MIAVLSTSLATHLAVVPIFVNAGAALLPTLVAGFTTVLATLLNPKELLTLFRRKPWLPVSVIAALVLVAVTITHLLSTPATAAPRTLSRERSERVSATTTDWTALA